MVFAAESFQKRGETNRVASDVHQATFWNQGTLVNINMYFIFTDLGTTFARITSSLYHSITLFKESMGIVGLFASTACLLIPPT
jgi:hypothetical protein